MHSSSSSRTHARTKRRRSGKELSSLSFLIIHGESTAAVPCMSQACWKKKRRIPWTIYTSCTFSKPFTEATTLFVIGLCRSCGGGHVLFGEAIFQLGESEKRSSDRLGVVRIFHLEI
jgi:hypothetical protein